MAEFASEFLSGLLTPLFAAFDVYNPTGNLLQFAVLFCVVCAIIRVIISIIFQKG